MTTFSDIVDAADHLSVDEQVTLIEILQRRIATRNRESLVRDVAAARAEFQAGQIHPTSLSDILAEVRGDRELIRSTAFIRQLRRYLKKHPDTIGDAEATLLLLSQDAFDQRLKTHKLTGDLEGVWACSAGYDLRFLFEFITRAQSDSLC